MAGVMRPEPKRARDPLATGAIFQASPASLRSPMPRLLMSPQQRALPQQAAVLTSPQPQQGAVMMMSPQPQHGIAAGSVDRFGHLSQRFNDLYSKSPAPKVLNQLQATSSSSSSTPQFVAPIPRTPIAMAAGTGGFSAASTTTGSGGGIWAGANRAPGASVTATASPAVSEDMDIDNLDATPAPPSGARGSIRTGARGSVGKARGVVGTKAANLGSVAASTNSAASGKSAGGFPTPSTLQGTVTPTLKAPAKKAPHTTEKSPGGAGGGARGGSAVAGSAGGGRVKRKAVVSNELSDANGGLPADKRARVEGDDECTPIRSSSREKAKVLMNWSIRLKRNSRGQLGIIVEGFLAEGAPDVSKPKENMQWKTSFIQDRDSPKRLRTSSGSVYVLQGSMDMGACREVPAEIANKFKLGFPANFKHLVDEAEAILSLQTVNSEASDAAIVAPSSSSAGFTPKPQVKEKADAGRGRATKGGAGKASRGRAGAAKKQDAKETVESSKSEDKKEKAQKEEWKNLNQMEMRTVTEMTTSRSGRRLQKPCDFWRQEVPIYENVEGERQLVGVVQGQRDLTSSFASDQTWLSPRTPVSGKKKVRSRANQDRAGVDGGGKRPRSSKEKETETETETERESHGDRPTEKSKRRIVKTGRGGGGTKLGRGGVRVRGGGGGGVGKMRAQGGRSGRGVVSEDEVNEEEVALVALREAEAEDQDVAVAEQLLAEELEREARTREGGAVPAAGLQDWDAQSKRELAEAYAKVRPAVKDFWAQVAKHVKGKTAQECHDEYIKAFPTPAAISKKADGRRRPATPKGAGARDGEAGEIEDDGLTLSANRGTAAWKKQVRHLVARDAEGHADDIFDSTPFKSTPFRTLASQAGGLVPSGGKSTGSQKSVGKRKHLAGRDAGSSLAREGQDKVKESPGVLRTPGLAGRDAIDAYIDRIRARTRQAAAAGGLSGPLQGMGAAGPTVRGAAQKQGGAGSATKPATSSSRQGSQRLVAAVKAIAKSGKTNAEDEEDDDDELQNELEL